MVTKEYLETIYKAMSVEGGYDISEECLQRMFYESKHCGNFSVHKDVVTLIGLVKVYEAKLKENKYEN